MKARTMNQFKLAAFPLLFALVASFGCNNSMVGADGGASKTAGGVAIIDLDEIGKKLGRSEEIDKKVNELAKQRDQELLQLKAQYKAQYDDHKSKMSAEPTELETQELQRLEIGLNNQLRQAQGRARNEVGLLKQNLIKELRDEIEPHALAVAKSRGRDVVLSKLLQNSPLYAFAEEVDITAEVLAKMSPAAAPAPAPAKETSP